MVATSSRPPKSSHYGTGHHRWCATTTIIIITTTLLVTTTSIEINIIMSVLITTTILVHLRRSLSIFVHLCGYSSQHHIIIFDTNIDIIFVIPTIILQSLSTAMPP